jgi:hypothetical protein
MSELCNDRAHDVATKGRSDQAINNVGIAYVAMTYRIDAT